MPQPLERIVKFYPAYERPEYGIHGVELLMLLKGPEGAVQFKLSTNWQLPHVQARNDAYTLLLARLPLQGKSDSLADQLELKGFKDSAHSLRQAEHFLGRGPQQLDQIHLECTYHPMPSDLGYHSAVPLYEGQSQMSAPGECEFVPPGQPCYYDGSSLNAKRIYEVLLSEGSDGVWHELEFYYTETFKKELVS